VRGVADKEPAVQVRAFVTGARERDGAEWEGLRRAEGGEGGWVRSVVGLAALGGFVCWWMTCRDGGGRGAAGS
jgi:hypothetical protein